MKRELLSLARQVMPAACASGKLPTLEWMENLLVPLYQNDPGEALALRGRLERRIVDIEMAAARRGTLFPFVRPMLDRLRQEGIKTAVITRNCTQALQEVFPDIEEMTDHVLTRDDVPCVKPDPGHLLAALDYLKADAHRGAMVGDHVLDIATGKGAGTWTAGVLTGVCTYKEFVVAGADIVADDGLGVVETLLGW